MYIKKISQILALRKNIIKSVSFAKGEFIWLLGNDDLVLPNTFKYLEKLFYDNLNVDFFYINSFNIKQDFITKVKLPFDTNKISLS